MAGQSVIGALRVVLGADTAHFDTAMREASSRLQGFANQAKRIGAVAGAAVGALVVSSALGFKNALEEADKLGKLAQSIGMSVEELSKLRYAAQLSDISLEAFGVSVGRLSRNMVQAAADTKATANQAFNALGISVKDSTGKLKSATTVIAEVADKFEGMQDGAGKTAIAIALFGRQGAAMIPMLNQGGKGLRDLAKEAEELGIVFDAKTAKAAEDFNDNMKRLQIVGGAFTRHLAIEMAPTLRMVSQALLDVAKDQEGVQRNVKIFVDVLSKLVEEATLAVHGIRQVGDEFRALMAVVSALKEDTAEPFKEMGDSASSAIGKLFSTMNTHAKTVETVVGNAFNSLKTQLGVVTTEAGATQQGLSSLVGATGTVSEATAVAGTSFSRTTAALEQWNNVQARIASGQTDIRTWFQDLREQAEMVSRALVEVGNSASKSAAPIIGNGHRISEAFDKMLEGVRKNTTNVLADADAIGMNAGARERLRTVMQAENFARENNIRLTDAQRMAVTKAANEAQQAALKLEGRKIFHDLLPPAQKYEQEINNATAALKAMGASQDVIAAKAMQIKFPGLSAFARDAQDLNKAFDQVATSGLNSFADGMTDIITKTKTLAEGFKDMANSILRDITRMAIKGITGQLLGGIFPSIGKNAQGTNNWKGGPTWVGERGPEIVNLPRGSQVVPNNQLGNSPSGLTFAPVINAQGADAAALARVERQQAEQFREFKRFAESSLRGQRLARTGVY